MVIFYYRVSLTGMTTICDETATAESQEVATVTIAEGVETICLVSPMEFAESCFSVPAVRAIKRFRSGAHLVVLCGESVATLWRSVPEVSEVVAFPDAWSARKIAKMLKESNFQVESSILWEAGEASKALAKIGVKQRIGYPAPGLQKWLTETVSFILSPGPIEHRVRYYLNLVQELGADAFVKENFQTDPLPSPPEQYRIAISKQSEYGNAYQWGEEKWEALKRNIEERWGEIQWVDMARDIVDETEIAEVLSGCSMLLASDGDVAHWAAHLGLPAIVLFGPNEPAWKRPLGKQSKVVRQHVACSPCFLKECPLDLRCQDAITVDAVLSVVEEVIMCKEQG